MIIRNLIFLNAIVAISYVTLGKLALLLAVPPGYATAIFPPAGIALAVILVKGLDFAPGVFLGSLLLNILLAGGVADPTGLFIAVMIALGSTLQAYVGSQLLRHFLANNLALDSQRDVAKFVIFGAPVACLTSSTIGIFALSLSKSLSPEQIIFNWWNWWVGDAIGVLIFTPLLLTFIGTPRQIWRARIHTIALPMAVISLIIVVLFLRASEWETEGVRANFQVKADTVATRMKHELEKNISAMVFLKHFVEANSKVDRETFTNYTDAIVKSIPGIQSVQWVPVVKQEQRVEFEQLASNNLKRPFVITEQARLGQLERAAARRFYYPIYLRSSQHKEQWALGYDLGSEIMVKRALIQAQASGTSQAMRWQTPVQGAPDKGDLLVITPVYEPGGEAGNAIKGFVVGVFLLHAMLEPTLSEPILGLVQVKVEDMQATQNQLLYVTQDWSESDAEKFFLVQDVIRFANGEWSIALQPTPAFMVQHSIWQAWLVLAAGLIFTGLLGSFLLVITGHTYQINGLVDKRTMELAQAHAQVSKHNVLMQTISRAQAEFISENSTSTMFNRLLVDLLAISNSAYGFIGEVLYTDEQEPYLKTHAITNIAWNEETRQFYADNAPQGLEFFNLNTLFGAVLSSKAPVISNKPSIDPRSGGLPDGHPPLDAFMGVPFFQGKVMLGMIGVANREGGYDKKLLAYLEPFLSTCANIVSANRTHIQKDQAALALRESEARLQQLVNNAIEAIVTVDTQGNIVAANPASEKIFGITNAELLGREFYSLIVASDQVRIRRSIHALQAQVPDDSAGQVQAVNFMRADHMEFTADVSLASIETERSTLFTVIMHDVTEREKLDKLKSEFISTVSHELRTPLTSINGTLSLLNAGLGGVLPEKASAFVEMALRNVNRLTLLINDILDLEKFQSNEIELELEQAVLQSIVSATIESNSGFAEKYQCELRFVDKCAGQVYVNVSPERLVQVLTNLISNAVKFSPPEGVVTITLQQLGAAVRVGVKDQGPGIPVEFQDKIFQRFTQLDNSDTRQHQQGTGLGLNIAKLLVERMDGAIGFDTMRNKGTTFYFDLPIVRCVTTVETS